MEIHELIVEMKLLERRLTLYEEKYGVLSEDFYASLTFFLPGTFFFQDDITNLKEKLSQSKKDQEKKEIIDQIRLKSFELDKVIANNPKASEDKGYDKHCYFNTGTCSFSDGDITGIEISRGKIRLVRWPDKNGDPKQIELRKEDICKIFSDC